MVRQQHAEFLEGLAHRRDRLDQLHPALRGRRFDRVRVSTSASSMLPPGNT
jgi:hypothetical protein